MTIFSRHARWATAAIIAAGAVGISGVVALSSASASTHSSASTRGSASAGAAAAQPVALAVKQIAFGSKLHHQFQPHGTGPAKTEALAGPDDIASLGAFGPGAGTAVIGAGLYVGFQNGVGSQGEPSTDGNLDSTVVQLTFSGQRVRQWDLKGKVDGLGVDPAAGQVIATVNEDASSSLYTISARTGKVVHYAYNRPLPHKGGTDAVTVFQGQIVISASAPGTSATAPASAPAAYVVRLNPVTKIAAVFPLYGDKATAVAVNGPHAGHAVALALTDPDSNGVVPASAPAFKGDFLLNSQGDQQLIFGSFTWWSRSLSVLALTASVDDTAWATAPGGELFTTDATANTVDAVSGPLTAGTAYAAVTPCNANSAPATCPAPGFPASYLGTVNLATGAIAPVTIKGATLNPKGLIFVPVFP
jgi:hypothetical protein